MTEIKTHKQLIECFGRPGDFARAVGIPYNITRKWYDRNRIPSHYWVRVIDACVQAEIDMSYKHLAEMIAK